MVKLEIVTDFVKQISKALGIPEDKVEDYFEVGETKEGWFYAKKHAKKWLEISEFKAMCALARDLGGDYVKHEQTWKVPSDYVKKQQAPAPEASSEVQPIGVTPHSVSLDKSKPSFFTVPIKTLLSMPFQSRSTEDPELEELAESVKTYGVLEPVLVRPKPGGLYEIVAGERRVKAAEKVGVVEVPVIIKWLTDEEAFIIQATENLQRKDWTEEEKTRYLSWLAKKTGWNAQQIADKLKMSYTWVVKYLPSEFKAEEKAEAGKLGGEARAEAYRESQDFATRRVAETPAGLGPATETRRAVQLAPEGSFTEEPTTGSPSLPSELGTANRSEVGPVEEKPQPQDIDTGFEWECPECHQRFQLIHVSYPDGKIKHKLEAKG